MAAFEGDDKPLITPEVLEEDGFGSYPLFFVVLLEERTKTSWNAVGFLFIYFTYNSYQGKKLYVGT